MEAINQGSETKVKSKVKTAAVAVGIAILAVAALCGIYAFMSLIGMSREIRHNEPPDYSRRLYLRWFIELPETAEELYNDGGTLKGMHYAAFALDFESEFLSDFTDEQNEECKLLVTAQLSAADFPVPEEYLPDFDADFICRHFGGKRLPFEKHEDGEGYMMYFPQSSVLLISFEQY